jgi:hypothetical protein
MQRACAGVKLVPSIPRDGGVTMATEELGFRFWAWLAAVVVGGGFALLIVFLIFSRAVYAWGIFGAFLALALVALVIGWLFDRRQARLYETEAE